MKSVVLSVLFMIFGSVANATPQSLLCDSESGAPFQFWIVEISGDKAQLIFSQGDPEEVSMLVHFNSMRSNTNYLVSKSYSGVGRKVHISGTAAYGLPRVYFGELSHGGEFQRIRCKS